MTHLAKKTPDCSKDTDSRPGKHKISSSVVNLWQNSLAKYIELASWQRNPCFRNRIVLFKRRKWEVDSIPIVILILMVLIWITQWIIAHCALQALSSDHRIIFNIIWMFRRIKGISSIIWLGKGWILRWFRPRMLIECPDLSSLVAQKTC